MGNTLKLFKQANLEHLINPALLGAGVGGLGYGVSELFAGDEEADTSTKLKNVLMKTLQGAGIGGLAGAGVGAGKQMLSQFFEPKQEVANLLKSNPGIDPSPHNKNHPIEALIGKMTGAHTAQAVGGGAIGGALTAARRAAGKHIGESIHGDSSLNTKSPVQQAAAFTAARDRMGAGGKEKSVLTRIYDFAKNNQKDSDLTKSEAIKHLVKANDKSIFPQNYGPSQTQQTQFSHSRPSSVFGNPTVRKTNPAIPPHSNVDSLNIIKKMLGAAQSPIGPEINKQHSMASNIMKELQNPRMSTAKQYGKGIGAGGAIGLGTGVLSDLLFKTYLKGKYSDPQLQVWNELAK